MKQRPPAIWKIAVGIGVTALVLGHIAYLRVVYEHVPLTLAACLVALVVIKHLGAFAPALAFFRKPRK